MPNTSNHELALSLYSGPRRTYEIFCLVADHPRPIAEILDAVPGDEGFVRAIVKGMVDDGLLETADERETYQLSAHGAEIKTTLDELPADAKIEAYQEAWGSPPPDGY
jgi:predicted transcriptional regulator